MRRPVVQKLLQRVQVDLSDDVDPEMPTRSPFTRVTVELTNGTIIEGQQTYEARGSARQPLGRDELWEKFNDCAGERLGEVEARHLFDRLQALERIGTVAEVVRPPVPATVLGAGEVAVAHSARPRRR